MKIEIGRKYRSERRHRVEIAGPVRGDVRALDGLQLFWSLGGDWYAEDGRYVLCRQVSREPLVLEHYLARPDHPENLTVALEE